MRDCKIKFHFGWHFNVKFYDIWRVCRSTDIEQCNFLLLSIWKILLIHIDNQASAWLKCRTFLSKYHFKHYKTFDLKNIMKDGWIIDKSPNTCFFSSIRLLNFYHSNGKSTNIIMSINLKQLSHETPPILMVRLFIRFFMRKAEKLKYHGKT